MKRRVYIETSIPSYYYETREDPGSIAKKDWTREWWDEHRVNYECAVSPAVLDELERGEYPAKDDKLKLVNELPVFEITEEILNIVYEYISQKLMLSSLTTLI